MSASTKKKAKPSKTKAKAKVTKTKKVAKAAPAEEVKAKKVAPKAKKVEEKKERPAKPVTKVARTKLGEPPTAIVSTRHVDLMHARLARGFSFGELESAGIPLNAARREDVSLDIRRRSVVDGNVQMLKGWFKSSPSAAPKETTEKPVAVVAGKKK